MCSCSVNASDGGDEQQLEIGTVLEEAVMIEDGELEPGPIIRRGGEVTHVWIDRSEMGTRGQCREVCLRELPTHDELFLVSLSLFRRHLILHFFASSFCYYNYFFLSYILVMDKFLFKLPSFPSYFVHKEK